MARDVDEPEATTQAHMSWLQLDLERRRVHVVLDQRRHATMLHSVAPVNVSQQSSLAQHTMEVRKSSTSVSRTGPHIPNMLTAMVCATLAVGDEWTKAGALVDSGSEHPPSISQSLPDQLGLS